MGQPIARGRWPPFDEQVAELLHAVDTLLRLGACPTGAMRTRGWTNALRACGADAGDRRTEFCFDHSRLKMAHVELASIDVRELDGSARRGDAGVEQETPHS